MENGEWEMGNGKWKWEMGNGKWKMKMEIEERETENGNGKRETKNGERRTGNGERGTGNAYLKSKASALSDRNFSTRKNLYKAISNWME